MNHLEGNSKRLEKRNNWIQLLIGCDLDVISLSFHIHCTIEENKENALRADNKSVNYEMEQSTLLALCGESSWRKPFGTPEAEFHCSCETWHICLAFNDTWRIKLWIFVATAAVAADFHRFSRIACQSREGKERRNKIPFRIINFNKRSTLSRCCS